MGHRGLGRRMLSKYILINTKNFSSQLVKSHLFGLSNLQYKYMYQKKDLKIGVIHVHLFQLNSSLSEITK